MDDTTTPRTEFEDLLGAFMELCRDVEHLPGEHDQADHAGNGGGGGDDDGSSKPKKKKTDYEIIKDDKGKYLTSDEIEDLPGKDEPVGATMEGHAESEGGRAIIKVKDGRKVQLSELDDDELNKEYWGTNPNTKKAKQLKAEQARRFQMDFRAKRAKQKRTGEKPLAGFQIGQIAQLNRIKPYRT